MKFCCVYMEFLISGLCKLHMRYGFVPMRGNFLKKWKFNSPPKWNFV